MSCHLQQSFRVAVLCALGVSTLVEAGSSSWKKAYFQATTPGSFARSENVDTKSGDVSEQVLVRLKDDDKRVVFESRYETKTGRFKGSKSMNRYTMKAGFPMEMEGLSFMRWLEKSASAGADGASFEMDAEVVKKIASDATNYGAHVVFKGAETVDGKACDHYTYSFDRQALGKFEGDYWLSEKVPFGVVKESVRGKDATGAAYQIETRLVESGPSLPRR